MCGGSAPGASVKGVGDALFAVPDFGDGRSASQTTINAAIRTATIITIGRKRFIKFLLFNRVRDRLVERVVDVDLNLVLPLWPVFGKRQVCVNLILKRVGGVINGLNLVIPLHVFDVDTNPGELDLGSGLGFVQIDHAMNGVVVGRKAGGGLTRLAIVVFGHIDLIDVDIGVRGPRAGGRVRILIAVV